jgi:predicted metal-dependent enzyme (double-stranded beta helix superfamily)
MPFDLDTFIADCLAAAPDQAAVAEVVKRTVNDPAALEDTFTRRLDLSNLGILHYSEELTVQHVVFPPAFRTGIHDHLTWAVIGTWAGYEDNHLFARQGNRRCQQACGGANRARSSVSASTQSMNCTRHPRPRAQRSMSTAGHCSTNRATRGTRTSHRPMMPPTSIGCSPSYAPPATCPNQTDRLPLIAAHADLGTLSTRTT